MKNIFLLAIISLSLFSCQNDDDCQQDIQQGNQQIDPTKIAEYHRVNSNGNITAKYIFDNRGVLSKIITSEYIEYYVFDSGNKLININRKDNLGNTLISQNVEYNNDNRITHVNDIEYTYNLNDDYYYPTLNPGESSYTYTDNGDTIIEYETYFNKYYDHNGFIQLCMHDGIKVYNQTIDTIITEYGGCTDTLRSLWHDGQNIVSHGSWDPIYNYYDENINPLYNNATNLNYAIGFFDQPFTVNDGKFNILFSQNNVIQSDLSDPSGTNYSYEFNDLGLPLKGFLAYYDELGTNPLIHFTNYYYQGDVIPN